MKSAAAPLASGAVMPALVMLDQGPRRFVSAPAANAIARKLFP
jgi:hypothetical protein